MSKPSYRHALRMVEQKQRTNTYLHEENERLREQIELYEGMKEGVAIRIADLEAENAKLRERIADREQAAQFFRSALCDEISFKELHAFTWHERWPWLDDDSTEQQPATGEQGEWSVVK